MPAKPDRRNRYLAWLANPAWLLFIWFGMTAGIGLLETPARFAALPRTDALEAGRVVFQALNKAELVALVLVLILVRTGGLARLLWGPCVLLALVLLAQSAWLLPELAERSQQITGGVEPGPSSAHALYSSLETAKLVLLLYLGFRCLAAGPRENATPG